MRIRLYGTSDDLVTCDGDIEGEAYAWEGLLVRVGDDTRATFLHFEFDSEVFSGWSVSVGARPGADYRTVLPTWPCRIEEQDDGRRGRALMVIFDGLPDGTPVEYMADGWQEMD